MYFYSINNFFMNEVKVFSRLKRIVMFDFKNVKAQFSICKVIFTVIFSILFFSATALVKPAEASFNISFNNINENININKYTDIDINTLIERQFPVPICYTQVQDETIVFGDSTLSFEATAYSLEEGSHITASGLSLYDVTGYCVASNYFPIGTKLYIECPSYPSINGEYVVLDTGGMPDYVIDISFWTVEECYNFGRRQIYVTVLN